MSGPDAGPGTILTDSYCLLPGDLRQGGGFLASLQQAGLDPGAPTLVLAECVLVYMEPQHSAALVAALGRLLSTAALVIYEQVAPFWGIWGGSARGCRHCMHCC